MNRVDKFLVIATVILLTSIGFSTLLGEDSAKVQWLLGSSSVSVEAGSQAAVSLKAAIDDTWYIYGLIPKTDEFDIGPTATEVELDGFAEGISLAGVKEPKPKSKFDKGFDFDIDYHEHSANFTVNVKAAAGMAPGDYAGKVRVYFQSCDPTRCLPPDMKELPLTVKVTGAAPSTTTGESKAAGNDDENSAEGDDYSETMESSGDTSGDDLSNASYDKLVSISIADTTNLAIVVGDTVYLNVTMKIADGWHAYSIVALVDEDGLGPQATTFELDGGGKFLMGDITESQPTVEYDEMLLMDVGKHKKEAVFRIPIYVPDNVKLEQDNSSEPFNIAIDYQICKDGACLPPTRHKIYMTAAIQATTWGYLILAMLAGAGALLTPCVFPMIPITVSFFTKRSEKNPGRGVIDSLVYSFGIILTFVVLGVLLTLLFGATGVRDFSTNPWVNIAIASVFIVFAFNLFGAFEIQIPTAILNKLNTASGDGRGFTGILLMALTFSLTSFTCTVPFVGTAFISTGAAETELLRPVLGMTAFATVFALPFFLLALFPALMQKLPRAGGWMNNIKVVMGFVEIAAAVKFISNADLVWNWQILSRDLFLATWIGCAIFIVIYILGIFRFSHDSPVESVGATRAMFALFFASITFWLFTGLMGKNLGFVDSFLPPDDKIYFHNFEEGGSSISTETSSAQTGSAPSGAGEAAAGENSEDFLEKIRHKYAGEQIFLDYDAALAESQKTGKPLFVDFTGKTCTNCRQMEKTMFPKESIKSRMEQMVVVQLYTDLRSEDSNRYKKMQEERYGDISLPLYVILTPQEQLISKSAYTTDEAAFVNFLDRAL